MKRQFSIGSYRINLYFPEHKLAIKCDEHDHKDRDIIYEIRRQKFFEDQLNCKFFHYNPDANDFMSESVLSKVFQYIYQKRSSQHFRHNFVSDDQIQKFFDTKRTSNKDAFHHAIFFFFNVVELCVVTINKKPWALAREVCRAVGYDKVTKAAHVIKAHVTPENYAHKWQLENVSDANTPINWSKDSQKIRYFH